MQDFSDLELYIASYYFTVTTITTVGYGDITATQTQERSVAIFLMIFGVVAFSFATGTLSSILASFDASHAILTEKLEVLDQLREKFNISQETYVMLKETAVFQASNTQEDFSEFLDSLAPRLRVKVAK
jgi:hypothetical protein